MQTFQIEGHATRDQTPFSGGGGQATQRELATAQDLFEDADTAPPTPGLALPESCSAVGACEALGHGVDGAWQLSDLDVAKLDPKRPLGAGLGNAERRLPPNRCAQPNTVRIGDRSDQ